MSNWARVVAMGTGARQGTDWLPEINDEVLVAFEHGDIHRPYVLGGVWNGKDAPPAAIADTVVDGKVRLRTFKTRTGHQLQFVEEDKDKVKQGVYLDTQAPNSLHLNDTDQYIELKSKAGHQARLDDKDKKLELKSQGGHQLNLDDNGAKLELTSTGDLTVKSGTSGSSKNIDLKGGNITLTGTTKITLKVGANSITLSNSGIEISGKPSVTIKGPQTTVQGDIKATLKGAMVDVQGSGMTKVQGSILKLN